MDKIYWDKLREIEKFIHEVSGNTTCYLGFIEYKGNIYPSINFTPYASYFMWEIEMYDDGDREITAMKFDEDEGYVIEGECQTIFMYENAPKEEWETGVEEFYKNKEDWIYWRKVMDMHDKLYLEVNNL